MSITTYPPIILTEDPQVPPSFPQSAYYTLLGAFLISFLSVSSILLAISFNLFLTIRQHNFNSSHTINQRIQPCSIFHSSHSHVLITSYHRYMIIRDFLLQTLPQIIFRFHDTNQFTHATIYSLHSICKRFRYSGIDLILQ